LRRLLAVDSWENAELHPMSKLVLKVHYVLQDCVHNIARQALTPSRLSLRAAIVAQVTWSWCADLQAC